MACLQEVQFVVESDILQIQEDRKMIEKRTKYFILFKAVSVLAGATLSFGVLCLLWALFSSSAFPNIELGIALIALGLTAFFTAWIIYSRLPIYVGHTFETLAEGETTRWFRFSMKEWRDLCEDMERVRGFMPKDFGSTFIEPLGEIQKELRCEHPHFQGYLSFIDRTNKKIPRCIRESIREFLDGKLSKELFLERVDMIVEMTWESTNNFGD